MFTTGEFANICNVKKQTLFHYDDIDLLKPEYVAPNGYRYYSFQQAEVFTVIEILKEIGMSLSDIKDFLNANNLKETAEMLTEKAEMMQQKIEALQRTKEIIQNKKEQIVNAIELDIDRITIEHLENITKETRSHTPSNLSHCRSTSGWITLCQTSTGIQLGDVEGFTFSIFLRTPPKKWVYLMGGEPTT